ncbi:Pentatricopeptide repeat-containing protein, mitochondrial [Vitis vinifera]|uniref:Pentatricopeptide repeat-containing protein, mitochondrial n=1 Tax=Vitis vinifera TaxID=29760 RepID=A0A438E0U5_VITVI|nr:Pentatricopeptide repeat-containing protein, mitochondrial [Vitis vinifera]
MQASLRLLHKSFCSWHQPPSTAEKLFLLSSRGHLDEAIRILRSNPSPNFPQLSSETYLSLIRSCIKFKAFSQGREIHKHMVNAGFEPSLVLLNNIMIMYSKFGDFGETFKVFEGMGERNLFSWTVMIGACSKNGDAEKAIELYGKMISSGVKADCFLYPLVLKSCGAVKDLRRGQCVHGEVLITGLLGDVVVMNSLIDMYMKCEMVDDSERVFDEMDVRDVITWTTMIVGYMQMGRGLEGLELLKEMLNSQVRPSSATLAGVLPLFSDLGYLELAKQIHGLAAVTGFEYEKHVGTALVDVYANCGGLYFGRLVFDRVKEKDVSCWNTMIKSYVQANLSDEAISLLKFMHLDGIHPVKSTWYCFFPHYSKSKFSIHKFLKLIKCLEHAGVKPGVVPDTLLDQMYENVENVGQVKELHLFFKRSGGISNSSVGSSLVRMYSKFAVLEPAQEIFSCLGVKELDSWNSILACYAHNGYANKASELFNKMRKTGIEPNVRSWNTLIAGFVDVGDFEAALETFSEMKWTNQRPNLESYNLVLPIIESSASSMIGKQLHCMLLRSEGEINKFLCTAFINMYGSSGNASYAIKLFDSMDSKDLVSWNSIISCLMKGGFLNEASRIFHEMEVAGIEGNTITWTTLVAGYAQHGLFDESLKHFRELQLKGLKPNSITIASILPACAQSATLSHGKSIHGYIIRNEIISEDLFVSNALIDMYIKCGLLESSEQVFRRLHRKDIISWNTIIQGYVIHGRAKTALSSFYQILDEGFEPDGITFAGVLSACSQAGMVNEGWEHFNNMDPKYGLIPTGKHYTCIVDLLGRAGLFEDARNFIFQMSLQPTASLWGALLSACKMHRNVEMAELAASHLLELQPENSENYMILSDIYAKARRCDDFNRINKMMEDHEARKLPGCSWIEIGNSVYSFTPENLLNRDIKEEVITMLLLLKKSMIMVEEGYVSEVNIMN